MSFEIFSPIRSHVNENEKKKKNRIKSKIKILKNKETKWSGDMVDMYLSPRYGVDSFSGIRENGVYGRTTTDDGRQRDTSSSAVQ